MTDESKLPALPEAVWNDLSALASLMEAIARGSKARDECPVIGPDELRLWAGKLRTALAAARGQEGEDAARLDALADYVSEHGGLVLHTGHFAGKYSGLVCEGGHWRTLREALDTLVNIARKRDAARKQEDDHAR